MQGQDRTQTCDRRPEDGSPIQQLSLHRSQERRNFQVENDVGDMVEVFSEDGEGDIAPRRILKVPHRAYALGANEEKDELYVSV
ncbi:MAG: hypothetical protein DMG15_06145 [Acidobacteria bacterium]|nr:MAG: hypothetical protein DMG15_06145 [Acidobacteriota bacterium]